MKISKRLLSFALSLAILLVSLPMAMVASADGQADVDAIIAHMDETFTKSLYKLNLNDYVEGQVPAGWESIGKNWGSTATGASSKYATSGDAKGVQVISNNTDNYTYLPVLSEANYVYEATFVPVKDSGSLGLMVNAESKTSGVTYAAFYAKKPTDTTPWVHYWNRGLGDSGRTSMTPEGFIDVWSVGTPITMKMYVYEGNGYFYLNGEYMGAVPFKSPQTGASYAGFYSSGADVIVTDLTIKGYEEPKELKIWNGSFDAALPTADLNGDGEIEINTPEEFAAVMKTNGKDANGDRIKYELTGDIYLNDTRVENWKDANPNQWLAPVKLADINDDNTFFGIINGNGYVVRGVYVDATVEVERAEFKDDQYGANYDASILAEGSAPELTLYEDVYAGLFPVIGKGAGIVAIGMEDSYIVIKDSSAPITLADGSTKNMNLVGSAGFVGVVANVGSNMAIIDQCYINDSVVLKGGRTAMIACGNKTTEFIISNCYASATVTPFTGTKGPTTVNSWTYAWDNNTGNRFMLVSGNGARPTIYSCYSFGNVSNNGNFTKNIAAGKAYTNVYYTSWASADYATQIAWNDIIGEAAKTKMTNLDWTKFETVEGKRPVLKVFTTHSLGTEDEIWNGTTTTTATDNNGNGYVEVYNANQLAYAIANSKSAEIMDDIWVNDIAVYAKGGFFLADRAPKTWLGNTYNANLNGCGNIVYGIFYNTKPVEATRTFSGLVPDLGGGKSIKNVGVENSFIRNNSHYSMGGITGATYNGNHTIEQCYVGEDVYINGYQGIGGITGGGSNGGLKKTITNCYSLAVIKADGPDPRPGGILGNTWNGDNYTIKNCYTTYNKLLGNSTGIVANNYASATHKYGDTVLATGVSNANMMGLDVFTNSAKMPNLNVDDAYQATMGYPILKIFDENYVEEEKVGEVWNGSIAKTFAGGSGTETDPYIIQKGSQLAKAINEFGLGGAYFKLDRDIYLNTAVGDSAHGWFEGTTTENKYYSYQNKIIDKSKTTTMGIFTGHIDGDGHTIYGLNYRSGNASSSSGLIPFMAAGTIKNLGLDKSRIIAAGKAGEEGNSAGGFIGRTKQTGVILIDRCYAGKDVSVTAGGGASGFVGYAQKNSKENYIEISNSYSFATLSSSYKSCAFYGDVWDTYYKLSNVFSNTLPINAGGTKQRASMFVQNDLSQIATTFVNVFAVDSVAASTDSYEFYDDGEGNITYTYTSLPDASMRGVTVFRQMTINGDDAFLYNIGYPTLKWQGNTLPTESELLAGLINITTAMPMTEYKIDTQTFIISGEFATGKGISINLANGDSTASFSVAADGTATLSGNENTITKKFTLGATATYKLAIVGGLVISFVNGECVGFDTAEAVPGYTATFGGFDLDNDSILVDLYINDLTFNSVEFGDVDVQLADPYGKTVSGGAKFDVTLKDTSYIDDMGYPVEYGYLVYVGDKIVQNLNLENAQVFEFNASTEHVELVGLGTKGQGLMFTIRGYAKVFINDEIDYVFYGDKEFIFSPIYEANKLYENEAYAEAIKAVYGASDKFVENIEGEVEFVTFGDYHYNDDQYTSQLSDLVAITDTADTLNDGQGADFILSLGDMFNDGAGSKEVTNYLLDGTYSGKDGTTYNNHNYNFFNVYGNHELEASNRLTYVNTTLTNSDVHWGDGSVGPVAAVTQKYAGQSVGNNDFEKRNELATGSYYWFEKNGIRIIAVNTNFSWNPNHINGKVVGWEHNLIGSHGSPSASTNTGRGFDEGAEALANTGTNSLGPVQLEWLESVLMDAVAQGTPCIVAGHSPMADAFGSGADAKQVRALFKKANDIRTGTVLLALNGHQHTNRQTVVEDVLYLDITTVRNSEWRSVSKAHYTDAHTFTYDYYDDNGIYQKSETRTLNSLSMGKNTWFAKDPVRSSVKVTASGYVELTGMKTSYMYDVIPSDDNGNANYKNYGYPGQNSGNWTLGESIFTVTEIAWPQ